MPVHRIRRGAALGLLLISLIAVAWGAWPVPVKRRSLSFSPADLGMAQGVGWQAVLTWPAPIRIGDLAELRLAVQPDHPAPVGKAGKGTVPGGRLEARLELPGMQFSPPGEVNQALGVDAATVFTWRVQASRPGNYPATMWLHWVGSAPAERRVLSAQRLEWQAVNLFGLDGPWARALGAAGAIIGAVFSLDGLVTGLWRRYGARRG